MKVLCIDDKIRPGDFFWTPRVKENCEYTTIAVCDGFGADGTVVKCYRLKEFETLFVFDCDRFIPLSDISETDMKRNYVLNPQPMISEN